MSRLEPSEDATASVSSSKSYGSVDESNSGVILSEKLVKKREIFVEPGEKFTVSVPKKRDTHYVTDDDKFKVKQVTIPSPGEIKSEIFIKSTPGADNKYTFMTTGGLGQADFNAIQALLYGQSKGRGTNSLIGTNETDASFAHATTQNVTQNQGANSVTGITNSDFANLDPQTQLNFLQSLQSFQALQQLQNLQKLQMAAAAASQSQGRDGNKNMSNATATSQSQMQDQEFPTLQQVYSNNADDKSHQNLLFSAIQRKDELQASQQNCQGNIENETNDNESRSLDSQEDFESSTTKSGKADKFRSKEKSSRYRGVSKCSKDGRWQARIRIGREVKYLGRYLHEVDAARAYDAAALKFHGLKAQTNFIRRPLPGENFAAAAEDAFADLQARPPRLQNALSGTEPAKALSSKSKPIDNKEGPAKLLPLVLPDGNTRTPTTPSSDISESGSESSKVRPHHETEPNKTEERKKISMSAVKRSLDAYSSQNSTAKQKLMKVSDDRDKDRKEVSAVVTAKPASIKESRSDDDVEILSNVDEKVKLPEDKSSALPENKHVETIKMLMKLTKAQQQAINVLKMKNSTPAPRAPNMNTDLQMQLQRFQLQNALNTLNAMNFVNNLNMLQNQFNLSNLNVGNLPALPTVPNMVNPFLPPLNLPNLPSSSNPNGTSFIPTSSFSTQHQVLTGQHARSVDTSPQTLEPSSIADRANSNMQVRDNSSNVKKSIQKDNF